MPEGDPTGNNQTENNQAQGGQTNDWRQMRRAEREQRREWMRARMGRRSRPNPLAPGIVLLIIGTVFLLSNLGMFVTPFFWADYWPVFLIGIGLMQAAFRQGLFHRLWGGWMAAMGGMFLAHNLGYIRGPVWALVWPMALIMLGIMFLLRSYGRQRSLGGSGCGWAPNFAASTTGTAHTLNEHAVFGGIQRRVDSQEFEGGEVTAIFGGVHLDLRGAATKKDEVVIEMNAIFGGVELLVPENWEVTVKGNGIFGGYEDKTFRSRREPPSSKRPHLIITGSAVFGGVTVM